MTQGCGRLRLPQRTFTLAKRATRPQEPPAAHAETGERRSATPEPGKKEEKHKETPLEFTASMALVLVTGLFIIDRKSTRLNSSHRL